MPKSANNMRARVIKSSLLAALVALLPLHAGTAVPVPTEDALKTALIYKLSKFVEWPEPATGDEAHTFGICILGSNPFGNALDALSDEQVNDAKIAVSRFDDVDVIGDECRIVYVSSSKQRFLGLIVESLADRPILTIGEMRNFARRGGMVQLSVDNKRVAFTINLTSAKRANLHIAAQLLGMSTVLQEGD